MVLPFKYRCGLTDGLHWVVVVVVVHSLWTSTWISRLLARKMWSQRM